MLTNTDVVDSTSGKKKCFVIQDKSQRPSNAIFAFFCVWGGETTNDIDFNLKGRKRCFLED